MDHEISAVPTRDTINPVTVPDRSDSPDEPAIPRRQADDAHLSTIPVLEGVPDAQLVSSLQELCGNSRRLLARLLAYLAEVDERRLHVKAACSSLFQFCVHRLGMSEGEAFRRSTASRLGKRFPELLRRIATGDLHLSAVVLLRDHLTEENCADLIGAACRKSKRDVQELLARRFPKPDAPSKIRKLPAGVHRATPAASGRGPAAEVRSRDRVEPLSEARYKIQLTARAELREKLARATELMRHRNPTGELAIVLERALDVLIATLEKERLGRAKQPKSVVRTTKLDERERARGRERARVPRAVRREVFARDGEQCTFVAADGRRCDSRAFLELDHVHPRALGGSDDVTNLQVLCRQHNQFRAERAFGREFIAGKVQLRQRKSPQKVGGATKRAPPVKAPSAPMEGPGRPGDAAKAPVAAIAEEATLPRQDSLGVSRRAANAAPPSFAPPAGGLCVAALRRKTCVSAGSAGEERSASG